MSHKLEKTEIESMMNKAIHSLEPREAVHRSDKVKPYGELVGTFYIASRNPLVRLAKKPFSTGVKLYRKIFQGYLEQKTQVDSYVVYELTDIAEKLNKLSVEELEASINNAINIKLDEKIQETHILIDRFKKEINYELVELRKGGSAAAAEDKKPFKAEIINQKRVKELKKVNVGAGMDIRQDYINLDHRALDGIDVVADVLDMPFEEESLDEIFSSHVVEHFVQNDLKKILVYWFGLLRKGGRLRIITPNIEDMAKRYAIGEVAWQEFRSVALGGQDYASDYHFNHFSIKSMEELIHTVLPEAEFKIVADSRRNGECFEMEVLVVK